MRVRLVHLAFALACALAVIPAAAADFTAGSIRISDPWSRATPSGAKVGAGYLTITNLGTEPDRLLGGSVAISGAFEVHEMVMTENVMRMRAMTNGLEIKPGETVALKPGGYHAMFLDLSQQIRQGQPIKGTLVFEKAGKVEIEYRVVPVGGDASSATAGGHGSGGHGGAAKH